MVALAKVRASVGSAGQCNRASSSSGSFSLQCTIIEIRYSAGQRKVTHEGTKCVATPETTRSAPFRRTPVKPIHYQLT